MKPWPHSGFRMIRPMAGLMLAMAGPAAAPLGAAAIGNNHPSSGAYSPVNPSSAAARQATPADFSSARAFQLAAGSADSAMVVRLPPGAYTAKVSGAGSTTGATLVEVYLIP